MLLCLWCLDILYRIESELSMIWSLKVINGEDARGGASRQQREARLSFGQAFSKACADPTRDSAQAVQ